MAALSVGISGLAVIFSNPLFLLGLFLWLYYLFYNDHIKKTSLFFIILLALIFYFYFPSKEVLEKSTPSPKTSILSGKVTSPIQMTEKKIEFVLTTKENVKVLVVYFLTADNQLHYSDFPAKYGGICNVSGNVTIPQESTNPGQFSYREYLLGKGIIYQALVDSLDQMNCSGASFFQKIYEFRYQLMEQVQQQFSSKTSEWLLALIFGNTMKLEEQTMDQFQRWGLSHILAISGLHVGILTSLLYFIFVKGGLLTKEKAQIVICVFLPVYALLAGGEPSVLRASGMIIFFILLQVFHLRLSVMDVLSLLFILLLLFNPFYIYQIGFQFSFLVTFGLILSRFLISNTKMHFFKMLRISFIAQMIILPLQIHYFHIFQPLSIIINVLVVPYFSFFVIPYMFFLAILSFFPFSWVTYVEKLFLMVHDYILMIVQWFDQHLNHPFIIGEFPLFFTIVYYVIFYFLMMFLQKRKYRNSFIYGLFICLLLVILTAKPYFSPTGKVTMLDIGQGDAFVIELPFRKGVFLIDAGAEFSFTDLEATDRVYEQIIKPFLYREGIHSLDAIFLSHRDIDHMGSVHFLVEDFPVQYVFISPYYEMSEEEKLTFIKNEVKVKQIEARQTVQINGQSFSILSPDRNYHSNNDNSLVLFSEIGGKRWLFTGDIGTDVEQQIARTYKNLEVDVLKVAHHGSRTSTDPKFIQQIDPSIAWISVGRNNHYGHPTSEVLQTLTNHGLTIFRTDRDGAVQYQFRKKEGTFFRFIP